MLSVGKRRKCVLDYSVRNPCRVQVKFLSDYVELERHSSGMCHIFFPSIAGS